MNLQLKSTWPITDEDIIASPKKLTALGSMHESLVRRAPALLISIMLAHQVCSASALVHLTYAYFASWRCDTRGSSR